MVLYCNVDTLKEDYKLVKAPRDGGWQSYYLNRDELILFQTAGIMPNTVFKVTSNGNDVVGLIPITTKETLAEVTELAMHQQSESGIELQHLRQNKPYLAPK